MDFPLTVDDLKHDMLLDIVNKKIINGTIVKEGNKLKWSYVHDMHDHPEYVKNIATDVQHFLQKHYSGIKISNLLQTNAVISFDIML